VEESLDVVAALAVSSALHKSAAGVVLMHAEAQKSIYSKT
jgi:hypothetical protein